MTKEEKERAFLIELAALTRKYGIEISGCGCCGSPYLQEVEPHEQAGYAYGEPLDRLMWLSPDDGCVWEMYSKYIVKGEK